MILAATADMVREAGWTIGNVIAAVLAFVEPGLMMFGEEAPVKRALSRSAQTVRSRRSSPA